MSEAEQRKIAEQVAKWPQLTERQRVTLARLFGAGR